VTKKRTPVSAIYSREAFKLCLGGPRARVAKPTGLEARGMMQLSAPSPARRSINSMLGAAHSAANPLTARFGVVHASCRTHAPGGDLSMRADPLAHERYLELSEAVDLGPSRNSWRSWRCCSMLPKCAKAFPYSIDPKQFRRGQGSGAAVDGQLQSRAIAAEDFERLYEEVFG